MKKLFILSPFIAFFFGFFFLKMTVSASSISASSETIEFSSSVIEQFLSLGFLSGGVFPKDQDLTSYYSDFSMSDAYSVDLSDISISLAPDGWLDTLNETIGNIYGSNGIISSNSDIYIGRIDNGYFTGEFYCDSSGNLLYSDSSLASALFNIKYGGSSYSNSQWSQFFSSRIESLNESSLYYSSNLNLDLSDISLYIYGGNQGVRNNRFVRNLYYLYCPNVLDLDNYYYIDVSSSGTTRLYLYSNNPNLLVTPLTSDMPLFIIGRSDEGYYINNTYYSYRYFYNYGTIQHVNYEVWESSQNYGDTFYNFEFVKPSFIESYYENSDIFSFSVVENSNDIFDITEPYSSDTIFDSFDTLNDNSYVVNPDFDNTDSVTSDNPYVFIPDDDVNVFPSTIPFPLGGTGGIALNPVLNYEAVTQPATSQIYESFFNFQIPFVENIFNRYPFCIPWDIKNFFMGFVSTPQAPAWDFDYSITVLGQTYTTHFEGDLSDFDPLARIFRNLIAISFIIFLAIYSYFKHS